MFPGEEFDDFRELIVRSGKKQNGKSLAKISNDALDKAFDGITLSDGQQALVDIAVNTINSDNIHKIEYYTYQKGVSYITENVFTAKFEEIGIRPSNPTDLLSVIEAFGGEGSTTTVPNGTLTIIRNGGDNLFLTNRPATVAHELFGHGHYLMLGLADANSQHKLPIQVENLVLRNMGIDNYRDGTRHGPKYEFIPDYLGVPILRRYDKGNFSCNSIFLWLYSVRIFFWKRIPTVFKHGECT